MNAQSLSDNASERVEKLGAVFPRSKLEMVSKAYQLTVAQIIQ
jgi:hypothetical protein